MPGTLAIDLGSSTTVVAWQEDREPPQLLPLPPYSTGDPPVVPSLLWHAGSGEGLPLIGRQVLEAGLAAEAGPGLCRDFKRRIGAGEAPGRGGLTPEQAGGLLLQRLWAALPTGITPHRLVLTAPIESYRGYRRWLQEECRSLPVAELALVDEPTAAAIGAGLAPGSRVLVVDLGGGTLDLSLVALEGGEGRPAPIAQLLRFAGRDLERSGQALRCARVIGKAGLPLGGRDLDRWIADALWPGAPGEGALLEAAERPKCSLSEAEEALEICSLPEQPPRELRLRRTELERLLQERGLLARLEEVLEAVLAGARREGIDPASLDAVLPVGGGSRLPLLRGWLAERFPGVPLRGERPVEAVALGALALTPGVRLQDVLTRGVSLRIWDQRSQAHRWQPLFVAGQGWPSERPLEIVLACSDEGQRYLEIVLGEPQPESRAEVVFEGGLPVLRSRPAGEATVHPWSTPPLILPLASPGRRGEDRLRLRFAIDSQGMLVLEGDDLAQGDSEGRLESRRLGPVR
ncbi:MAG: Hsp70 family protein [Cyanobium sp.]